MTQPINILQLHNLLNKSECQKFISLMDQDDRINQSVKTSNSNYGRIYLHIPDLAEQVWKKIKNKIHTTYSTLQTDNDCILSGIRPVWSATKYQPGGYLGIHMDGQTTSRKNGTRSWLTILIYLNDDFEGGQTNYYSPDTDALTTESQAGDKKLASISPVTGMAMIMEQDVLHNASPIISGCKYILRSDIVEYI